MAEINPLEQRVAELADQVQVLRQRVEHLEGLVVSGVESRPVASTPHRSDRFPPIRRSRAAPRRRLGRTPVLGQQGGPAPPALDLCFLLVAALMLRAITDYNVIDKLLGSALGMAYAAGLIAAGWYKYRTRRSAGPGVCRVWRDPDVGHRGRNPQPVPVAAAGSGLYDADSDRCGNGGYQLPV